MTRADCLRLLTGGALGAFLGGLPRAAGAAPAYDFWFTRLRYDSGDWDVDQRMPSNILTSLVDYTNLRVDPEERVVRLSDPAMPVSYTHLRAHET